MVDTLEGIIDYELIVIYDGIGDKTKDYLKRLEYSFKVLFNTKRGSFAKNNNYGASKAKGEFLCFLNNDVFVQNDWLLPILDVFKKIKKVGFVGNVQRYAFSNFYDHMGIVFGPKGNPRHYGQWFKNLKFKGEVKKWSAVTAACCVIERETFEKMHGFDESFINGSEDVDLCLKLNRQGYSNYIVHDSVVLHVKGATEGRKRFNKANGDLLLKRWGKEVKKIESVNDQVLHARNYIYRGMVRPFSTNFWKWFEAILIYLRIKRLR